MAQEVRRVGARRTASLVLVVLGTVILFVGGIALYAREEIFDPDAFAQHASESLRDDRVDNAVANPIVDKVIEFGPDQLINARPLLAAGTRGVLASQQFRDAFRDAAARVHRQLFSRERDKLILNIADAGAIVIDGVKSISPQTAKKIPKDLEPGLIKLTKSDFAITTVRTAEKVRFLGLFLPFLGIALLAGAVVVAPDRRRGVVAVSAAVAIACAVGFIALVIGRSVLLSHFDGDVTREAIGAVFDNFLGGLRGWFIVVGVGAIVLAAAASTVGEVEPTAPVRRMWERVIRTPESTAWRAIRAVVLLLASVFVVVSPDLALNVVAVVLGAYALFFAMSEILFLIAPPPPEAERVPLQKRVRPRAAIIAGGALVALLVLVIVLLVGGDREVKRPGGPVEACNGYPELCDRQLNEVAFPGAHNAMSAANADFITPNQETKIQDQLDAGIRVLLVDAYYGIKRSSGPVLTDLKREQDRTKANEAISEQFGKEAVKRVQSIQERVADTGGEGEQGTYFCHIVCELGAMTYYRDADRRAGVPRHPPGRVPDHGDRGLHRPRGRRGGVQGQRPGPLRVRPRAQTRRSRRCRS